MHTNLTYQPQPALCYISKISALGVTTGWLLVSNIQFKITALGVTTDSCRLEIYDSKSLRQEW